MILPTVHMGGTSGPVLIEQLCAAMIAVSDAIAALNAAEPNARDYYPQGELVIRIAQAEHRERIARLATTHAELATIAEHVSDRETERHESMRQTLTHMEN